MCPSRAAPPSNRDLESLFSLLYFPCTVVLPHGRSTPRGRNMNTITMSATYAVCSYIKLLSITMSNEKELSSSAQAESIEHISTIQYSVFSKWRKRYIVGLVAVAAWFSTLSSFIYYPSVPLISKDLRLSIAQVNLSITTYMAISAIAPSITGDASDIY